MARRQRYLTLFFVTIYGLFLLVGCASDDPAAPVADPPATGTIVVNITPSTLNDSWTITGPAGYTTESSGAQTLAKLAPGQYTLVCSLVAEYITPANVTQTLVAGGTVTFNGTYVADFETGTIIIEQFPHTLAGAAWSLTGPRNESGSDDKEFKDMPAGEYGLTWAAVDDYFTPSNLNQTLVGGGEVTFSATYLRDPATIEGFVLIPPVSVSMPATFTMGTEGHVGEPAHQVTLTNRFVMLETEVTNAEFVEALQWAKSAGLITISGTSVRDLMDDSNVELINFASFGCQMFYRNGVFGTVYDLGPAVQVSWYGAVAYCDWMNIRSGLPQAYDHSTWECIGGSPYDAPGYRLPTEAEWEFACRAGTTTPFNTGDCLDATTEANYRGTNPFVDCPFGTNVRRSVDVGSYPANGWGLFDMHGNLFEWCSDFYGDYGGDETDPIGPETGDVHVLRGGDWFYAAGFCRSAYRHSDIPQMATYGYGFRPVRTVN